MGNSEQYVFDQEWATERERLALREAALDARTIRHLEAIGVADGWRCLEVGAGGGSVAKWLCKRVGQAGSVVATDLQTKFLEAVGEPNLEVRCHNIVTDELEEVSFDLVHTRSVLQYIPGQEREVALKHMVAALRSGGCLFLEESDVMSLVPVSRLGGDLFQRATDKVFEFLSLGGFDPHYGRGIGADLRGQGLIDVRVEGRFFEVGGESPWTGMWALVFEQLRNRLVAGSLLTSDEVDEVIRVIQEPDFCAINYALMAAWGRKP